MRESDPGTERKCLEILRILGESREPMGAKHLSERMAEQGFILSDRAVQYYLHHLDEVGFTKRLETADGCSQNSAWQRVKAHLLETG